MRATLLLSTLLLGPSAAAQSERRLDDFSSASRWRAEASDGVAASARPFEGGLRLDYDFSRGSGYAFLRRELPLELPENFELSFRIRGEGAANALELKLVDASGENVWWHRRPDYVPPGEWTTIRVRRRQIEFAWGPTQYRTLRRAAAIEFVVAAGSGGGRGWIAVDDLAITPLPVPPAVPPEPRLSGGDGTPLVLDLGYRREFGGLKLGWAGAARDYSVQLSDDRRAWRTVREVRGSDGGTDWLRLEESEARFVRIVPADRSPSAPAATLSSRRSRRPSGAASIRAASSASRITGRWRRRPMAAIAASSTKAVRSRSAAAASAWNRSWSTTAA